MENNQRNKATWNKLADWYQSTFLNDLRYKICYDTFIEMLSDEQNTVLEIGCGPGNIAVYVGAHREQVNWTGIDYAPAMIEKAKSNFPKGDFKVADAADVQHWKTKFDALVLGFCVPYFSPESLCNLLPAWMKRLNDNGIVYLSFIEDDPKLSGTYTNSYGDTVDIYYYEEKTIREALETCGVGIANAFLIEYPRGESKIEKHRILIGRKEIFNKRVANAAIEQSCF